MMIDTADYIGGSFIEGLGDDLVQVIAAVLLVLVVGLIYWW